MELFTLVRRTSRIIDDINTEASGSNLPDLIAHIRREPAAFCAGGVGAERFFLRSWLLLRLINKNARRQPCFFRTMILLAYESLAGNEVEVNIGISAGEYHYSEGHCWLSKNGRPVFAANDPMVREFTSRIGDSDSIVYWLRGAIVSEKKTG